VDSFKIGQITVRPKNCSKFYGTETLLDWQKRKLSGARDLPPKTEGRTGRIRYKVDGLTATGDLLVVGVIQGGTVAQGMDEDPMGSPFIITKQTEEKLVETLHMEEEAAKWILRILSFVMLFVGFIGIFNPIVSALEKIGEFGCGLDIFAKLFYLVDALLSLFIVVVAVVFINYFWIVIFLVFLLFVAIGFAAHKALSKRKAKKG